MRGGDRYHTGIEGWDLAIVAGPEVFALVFCVFWCGSVIFVWVVGVHFAVGCARKYDYMERGIVGTIKIGWTAVEGVFNGLQICHGGYLGGIIIIISAEEQTGIRASSDGNSVCR
jgi:hypothetical protein